MSPPQPLPPQTLRAALGHYATGVTLITCRGTDGQAVGFTCNSFNALSLQPPLVLWSLREHSLSLPHFHAASHFAVNVLAQDQLALAQRFATAVADRFGAGSWRAGLGGAPLLEGCCAVLECAMHSQQRAGDHVLFIGEVLQASAAERAPLLFQRGRFHALGEAA